MTTSGEHKLLYYFKKWVTISENDEALILSAFEPALIKKKKDLLVPGEVCKYIYFIKQGSLRSYFIDPKGIEHIYQIRLDNSWISDLESFFSKRPSKYYIEALEDSQMLRISTERLEQLYEEVPTLERYFRILFQKAYINALERLNATMWESAVERYNDMLKEHPDMFQRIPLVYIASYLGITPESLSRIRKKK
ncbi:cyclic nucleotide-binding domain-containing protein [Maribellus comscasis]|uniref:Cyclic nucleotide-binding domain-containing protein n=1 Tax=Maribellus comscasis TaxID=2681766 RepID=A0A6I6JWY1_9BACT|nr:Crp/Fnr family transcriptional regulator [Maribellus comscasis]QGY45640.1 cyclic nucleotide-binding domain-containing protein [Maribellus comscasis]